MELLITHLNIEPNLNPGETLLVLGAAGGVGLAAVELGKIMGARVIASASTDDKLMVCKKFGADELINYSTQDFRSVISKITNGKGVDVVCDPVGGEITEKALRCYWLEREIHGNGFCQWKNSQDCFKSSAA